MGGFFDLSEVKSTKITNKASCFSCGLYKNAKSPKIEPQGNFKKEIMVIGEAPGNKEDETGKLWQGKTGKRLQREFRTLRIDLFDDCISLNAVQCKPKKNAPTNTEISNCLHKVLGVIDKYQPKVIVLLGSSALCSVIGHTWGNNLGSISRWRGMTIPDIELNAWLCPTFHPSYIEHLENPKEVVLKWRQDLKNALALADKPKLQKREDDKQKVKILTSEEACDFMRDLHKNPPEETIAFDYETTGLKPHASGHQIICCSFCYSEEETYAFPINPYSGNFMGSLKNVLTNPMIKKCAQNMKFEMNWTRNILGYDVNSVVWDTMLATHILDNRPYITGLKFQTYVNFGVAGYDEDVSSYLKSGDDKNSNAKNKLDSLEKDKKIMNKILEYCALDSLYTFKLMKKQQSLFRSFANE